MNPSQTPRATATITRKLALGILAAGLVAGAFLAGASPPGTGRAALPLPLGQSIHGFATPHQPALYAVEVATPGFLAVEAHGSPPASHEVRLLGRAGRSRAGGMPLPAIRGRHVHRIAEPGIYFVEVKASGPGATGFRLFAWTVDWHGDTQSLEPMDETDELSGGTQSLEPMDETDEIYGGTRSLEPMDETDEVAGGTQSLEPMDETDEIAGGTRSLEPMDETDEFAGTAAAWREISGYGLLEVAAGGQIYRHPLCSWTEQPELLSTFTCARQLRVSETRAVTVHPISPNGTEMIGIELAAAGQVTLDAASRLEAAVFDAGGRPIAELAAGEPVWLEAGRAYLRIETSTGTEAVVLDVEID